MPADARRQPVTGDQCGQRPRASGYRLQDKDRDSGIGLQDSTKKKRDEGPGFRDEKKQHTCGLTKETPSDNSGSGQEDRLEIPLEI